MYKFSQSGFRISILLATYNWPSALHLCLESLREQTDLNFEIIIADDGSNDVTKELINEISSNFPVSITHLWQEDHGFRKSKILNLAIQSATGDYLIFLDGDCIVQPDFVAQHRRLARPSKLITGSRILLSKQLTENLCPPLQSSAQSAQVIKKLFSKTDFLIGLLKLRLMGEINKLLPLLIKLPNHPYRVYPAHVWKRIKGCNIATEVLHLWHKTQPSDQEHINRERVLSRI